MTTLYKYQKAGVRQIDLFGGRCLLADEMGLGKTIQALWWAKYYLEDGPGPVVVVCPAGIKWNWEVEAKKHVGVRATILDGRKPKPGDPIRLAGQPLYVIGSNIIGGTRGNTWCNFLRRQKPRLVIGDEVHEFKTPSARRTREMRSLVKKVKHVILIGGTPMTNKPMEMWVPLDILDPTLFPNRHAFGLKFCGAKMTPWGWKYDGATNLARLHRILKKKVMIRRRKADVLKDLPEKSRFIVPLTLDKAAQSKYDELHGKVSRWIIATRADRGGPHLAKLALRARGKVNDLKRLAAELKLPQLTEWVESFLRNTDGKLIFFGVHKRILRPLHAHFKACSVLVDGSVTGRLRQAAVEKFSTHKSCRVFFGNVVAAGVGWNGTAANTVAFGELDWLPALHTQAEARPHRIGQRNAVQCYYLVAKGTMEEGMCRRLQERQEYVNQVLDGSKKTRDGLNLSDILKDILKVRA